MRKSPIYNDRIEPIRSETVHVVGVICLVKAEALWFGRVSPDAVSACGAKSNVVGTGEEAWRDEITPL
jgi:hypothetical protein